MDTQEDVRSKRLAYIVGVITVVAVFHFYSVGAALPVDVVPYSTMQLDRHTFKEPAKLIEALMLAQKLECASSLEIQRKQQHVVYRFSHNDTFVHFLNPRIMVDPNKATMELHEVLTYCPKDSHPTYRVAIASHLRGYPLRRSMRYVSVSVVYFDLERVEQKRLLSSAESMCVQKYVHSFSDSYCPPLVEL